MTAAPELDVLMVVDAEIATSHIIEQVLRACAPLGVRYRKRLLTALQPSDLRRATMPVFVRCSQPRLTGWTRRLAAARHPYFYYVDDNFWQLPGESALARYYRYPVVRRALDAAVRGAREVLVNSPVLAAVVAPMNPATHVLPTFFDFSLIDREVPAAERDEREIRIGFAGSPSRVDDLDLVATVTARAMPDHPEVVFEFAGVLPRGLAPGPRVRFFPYVDDYDAHIRFQAARGWDIGLAPLVDTEANRCKTNNKYREYGACRTAGIYSSIPPYVGSVVPDETGLLVDNTPEAWQTAVRWLVEHPLERRRIADAACAHVHEAYQSAAGRRCLGADVQGLPRGVDGGTDAAAGESSHPRPAAGGHGAHPPVRPPPAKRLR